MALRTHHMQHHEAVTRAHPTQHLDQWRAARGSTCRTGGFSAKSLEQPTSFAPSQHCAPIHATVALQQLHSNEHAQCGYINTRSLLAAHHSPTRRTAPLHLATGPWSRAIRVTWQVAASPALLPQATTSLLNATWRRGRGEANSPGLHPEVQLRLRLTSCRRGLWRNFQNASWTSSLDHRLVRSGATRCRGFDLHRAFPWPAPAQCTHTRVSARQPWHHNTVWEQVRATQQDTQARVHARFGCGHK
jgi:hypothetical protein